MVPALIVKFSTRGDAVLFIYDVFTAISTKSPVCPVFWHSREGLAEPPGVVPPASPPPPPPRVMVRDVSHENAKIAGHFCCSANGPLTCSANVPAVFERPLEYRWTVAGTSYWNVAGTRSLGLANGTLLRLFKGGNVRGGCAAASSSRTNPGLTLASRPSRQPSSSVPAWKARRPPPEIPQSTCLARLGRASSTGNSGCPSIAQARPHQPQH